MSEMLDRMYGENRPTVKAQDGSDVPWNHDWIYTWATGNKPRPIGAEPWVVSWADGSKVSDKEDIDDK
jgi:hypothetical protein